jgi:hypothetical protein
VIDMGQATETIANTVKAYGTVCKLVQSPHAPVDRADSSKNSFFRTDFTAGRDPYSGGSFKVGALPHADPSPWTAGYIPSLINFDSQCGWLSQALRPGPARRVRDDAELGWGRAGLRTAHGNLNAAWVEHEARSSLKGKAPANVSAIRAFCVFIL